MHVPGAVVALHVLDHDGVGPDVAVAEVGGVADAAALPGQQPVADREVEDRLAFELGDLAGALKDQKFLVAIALGARCEAATVAGAGADAGEAGAASTRLPPSASA